MLMMVVKRMLIAVPSLIGVVIVTFLLTRALPGDPAAYFAGPAATKEAIEQIRVKLGLDRPLYVQFIHYVGDLARGDLGNSLTTGQSVGHEIKTRLPASAELTLLGLMVSIAIAVPLAPIARMTRASMLAVLASDFVRTARASGLAPFTVVVTYAFRNAMLPVVTTLGMVFSFLLGANVLVEKVFAWPGIGSFAVEALIASDFAPLQGFVLTMAVMYVVLNLLIDVLYGLIDPRVRIEA
jgi:ABC-type dipeptide/oligopeptide/nickel transport system permease component